MTNPAPAPAPSGATPTPVPPRPPIRRPPWLSILRWIAYHWWLFVGIVFLGNYLPGAVIDLVQFGWNSLGSYLTSWGFLHPFERANPPLFFAGAGVLVATAVLGFVVERQEIAADTQRVTEHEQKLQATHEAARSAEEKAERVRQQVESLEASFRTTPPAALAGLPGPPQDDGLLPPPEPFVGRAADLTWLEEQIRARPEAGQAGPIAAVSGLGGIGKTALASQAIKEWRMQKRFLDGLAIVLANNQRDARSLLRAVLQRFDLRLNARVSKDASLAELATAAHNLLDGKDALIMLDNLEPDDPVSGWRASDVLDILRATGVAVLLTARQDVPGLPPGATRVLDVLPNDEARELFARSFSGQPWVDLSVADQRATGMILGALGRHTLAVTLAARYAATTKRPLVSLAAELSDPQRALALHLPDAPRSVQTTFVLSYQALPDQTQRLFRALGAAGTNEVGRRAALALGRGLRIPDPQTSVDLLVARGLAIASQLESLPEGADTERLSLHPLLRAFAGELLGRGSEWEQAEDALATFYADYTSPNMYGAFSDTYLVIAADDANIVAALDTAHNQGKRDNIVRNLSWNLAQYWRDRSKAGEGLLRLPWGITSATILGQTSGARYDRLLEGVLRSVYGDILANTGKVGEAQGYFEQALALYREVGDRWGEGVVLSKLGRVAQVRGQPAEAQGYFEQALGIDREVGNRQGEGAVLSHLGSVAQYRGQPAEAQGYFEQALGIDREVGDRQGEGAVLSHLGRVALVRGQPGKAQHYFEQALIISREVGNRQGEGAVLSNLGSVALARGQSAEALRDFEQALGIDREVGNRQGEGVDLTNLGRVAQVRGQPAEAQGYFEQALIISREVGNRQGERAALSHLGSAAQVRGQPGKAQHYFEQALIISREVDDRRGEGAVLSNLGSVAQHHGQLNEAQHYFEQALTIDREVGNRTAETVELCYLGQVAFGEGNLSKAQTNLDQSLVLCREIGVRRWEGVNLSYLARITEVQDDLDHAEELHRESLAIALEVEHGHDIADATAQLGQFLLEHARGSGEEGCRMLTEAIQRYDEMGVPERETVLETMKRLGCV